jgi:hypothetical protein
MEADQDGDGKLSFEEFALMVSNTVRSLLSSSPGPYMESTYLGYYQANDTRRLILACNHPASCAPMTTSESLSSHLQYIVLSSAHCFPFVFMRIPYSVK